MNYIITDEPDEYFEVKGSPNEAIAFIFEKKIDGKWQNDTHILNKQEVLELHQALEEHLTGKG